MVHNPLRETFEEFGSATQIIVGKVPEGVDEFPVLSVLVPIQEVLTGRGEREFASATI